MTTDPVEKMLDQLHQLAVKRRAVTHDQDQLVLALRSPGLDGGCLASWQEVADALGVSRQAAWRMYRAPKEAPPS